MSNLWDIKNLKEITDYYGMEYFIETGCEVGNGLKEAKNVAEIKEENLFSCDINSQAVESCSEMLPKAHITYANSLDFLNLVLPTIHGRTLIWLDAHHPEDYGIATNRELEWPLYEELLLVKQLKKDYHQDLIFCDDVHSIPGHEKTKIEPPESNFYLAKNNMNEYQELLKDTHNILVHPASTFILMFFPKDLPMQDWASRYW